MYGELYSQYTGGELYSQYTAVFCMEDEAFFSCKDFLTCGRTRQPPPVHKHALFCGVSSPQACFILRYIYFAGVSKLLKNGLPPNAGWM